MALMRRIFGPTELTVAAKRSLRRERLTELTLPVALAMLEGGFVGVIATKIYGVSPFVLGLLSAAPMFGNLSSYFWNRVATARAKVPLVVALQIGTLTAVLVIAFAPANQFGAYLLVAMVVLSRFLMAGVITVRSIIWSLNYEREVRARATGRLQLFSSAVMVLTSALAATILDSYPESFRYLYAGASILALVGVVSFSRLRVVGELKFLVSERREDRLRNTRARSVGFLRILRTDKRFARFELHQFLSGISNMMLEAPLIYLVSREMDASFTVSIALSMVIPFALSLISLPLWARHLDDVHVAEFRVRLGWIWVASQLGTWIGALLSSIPVMALGRAVMGVARGGGSLAWQLGHNDFAKPEQVSAYMGVHVTLTGVRGLIAPFAGIFLYTGWNAIGVFPSFAGLGIHLFLVAAAIGIWSWWGFWRLHLDIPKSNTDSSTE